MSHATSLTEWAQLLFLGIAVHATGSALLLIAADLSRDDARRVGDRLLVEIVRAKCSVQDAALAAAVLLMILTAPEATP